MKNSSLVFALLTVVCATATLSASPYIDTGEYFVEPGSWTVGDAGSTYQAWDDFFVASGNTPDAGYSTNPAIATQPVVNSTGLVTGTKNFYHYGMNYAMDADIYNHGTGGTDGTHVIVQTAATTGSGESVVPDSLEIVDLGGSALTGGDNASALVDGGLLASGTVGSGMGPTTMQIRIWEFFLPGYTGDFTVQWDERMHSSFDQLRVDSLIAANAQPATPFTFQEIVPEPSAVVMALLGLVGIVCRRRNQKSPSLAGRG